MRIIAIAGLMLAAGVLAGCDLPPPQAAVTTQPVQGIVPRRSKPRCPRRPPGGTSP